MPGKDEEILENGGGATTVGSGARSLDARPGAMWQKWANARPRHKCIDGDGTST
jgi:hypothetical protein